MSGVRFTVEDGIGVIVLDDAPTKNALDDDLVVRIRQQLTRWSDSGELRGLMLTGANGAFSSGGKLNMIEAKRAQVQDETGREEMARGMRENATLVEQIAAFPAPTIAVIDGVCVGAAIAWACACDLRISSDRAKFITGFAKIGLGTDFGTSRLLAETVGKGTAADWLFTSPVVDAATAHRSGLVSRVYPVEELRDAATELFGGLHRAATLAIRANLADSAAPLGEALDHEAIRFAQLL